MTNPKFTTIEEYIASFPQQIQAILKQVDNTISKTVPEAVGNISYGIPVYKVGKKAVYFAGYKEYFSIYPMYGVEKLESGIAQYRAKGTKDTIHFLYKDVLPLDLIARIAQCKLN
jgi:uncharacterized protein YdhG (YjbR/CyaY superfamily)